MPLYADEFDKAETLKRYPWLAEDPPPDPEEPEPPFEEPQADNSESPGPDYWMHKHLPDDLLPTLDFGRYDNVFNARTARSYIGKGSGQPRLRKIFSDFWHEGEISILFAETGRGKSVLAVQIARSIAAGEPIAPFELETDPQRVLYFDFELSDAQFALRYANTSASGSPPYQGGVAAASADGVVLSSSSNTSPVLGMPTASAEGVVEAFPDNFIRCAPRLDTEIPYGFRDYSHFLNYSIRELVQFTGSRVVIIDNITYLNVSTENSTATLRLMQDLQKLKRTHDLSILVLAHTPKRHPGAAININDMQGSKMLANFADNIFTLGTSFRDPGLRYLKHLKPRNCPLRYHAENVPVLRLAKHDDGFLGFTFTELSREPDHAAGPRDPAADRKDLRLQARSLAAQGLKQREIAAELKIGLGTVNRYLKPENES